MKRKILILTLTLLLTLALVPSVFAQEPDDDFDVSDFCLNLDSEFRHPTAERLATAYEVDYETIMGWFCEEEYGFGEIKHALKTSTVTELTPEELLAQKTELGGWGLVWQDLGLIGRDKDTGSTEQGGPPPGKGRPEWKGPPPGKGTP